MKLTFVCRFECDWNGTRFFESKRSGGGRGVKEKDTVLVSSSVMEEHVDATVNTKDVNVGQTPTSPNVNQKPCTSYANLFTTGSSRKAMNFRTLFTSGGNGVDVVVLVKSIRATSARFVNTVKLHGVPVTAFSEDGLSATATKLDTPLMLDSYTSDIIGKLKKLIIDGKVTHVDDDGKPLKKIDYPGDHDSEDEVESVDNDMAHSMASENVGFGTKSLLE
ncbi:hypothetical protein Tco_0146273 [Tanacetum coccineum]